MPSSQVNPFSSRFEPYLSHLPVWRRYGAALLCVLIAFAIRDLLTPGLGAEFQFMLFIAASLVAAWYGGVAPGIVALLSGLFLLEYFTAARAQPHLAQSHDTIHFIRYLFTSSLGILLLGVLHRNRCKLEQEVARRQRTEASLLLAQGRLREHAGQLEERVTERTRELSDSVASLRELLYHIAHNLRAPLRALEGYTTALAEEYAPRLDATALEYSQHINAAARRMDALIQALLEYGRLGHIKIEIADVDLNKAVHAALQRLAYEIKVRRAQVKVAGSFPDVRADAEILVEALGNLVENAMKFVAPGTVPVVEVRAEQRDSAVRLSVQDNGVGIDPQYHHRIFRPFEVLHSRPDPKGTGIGLAIVEQGVQRMGGKVGVSSTPGKGSCFWIELPAAAAAQNHQSLETPSSPTSQYAA